MTPLEHFREAEQRLAEAEQMADDNANGYGALPNPYTQWTITHLVATAHVHAALAGIAQPAYTVVQNPTRALPPRQPEAGAA